MKTKKLIFRKIIVITFFIFISTLFLKNVIAVEPDEILKNEKQEMRARIISKNIRCMVCQNQSIDESNSPLAKDLRVLIRNKILDGTALPVPGGIGFALAKLQDNKNNKIKFIILKNFMMIKYLIIIFYQAKRIEL